MTLFRMTLFPNRIGQKDRAFFVRQLAIMVSSGVPITQSLRLTVHQMTNLPLRRAVEGILSDVEHGQSFSVAASRYPDLFDEVMIAMLRSGEASGQFQSVLTELADQFERSIEFSAKVRNALLYPAFVFIVMIIVAIIMTTVVIPRLASLFEDSTFVLPWSTRILVFVSSAIIHYWYIFILIIVAVIYLVRSYLATAAGRAWWHTFQLSLPVVGPLITTGYLVRLTDLLGMLVRSGVPITEALRITGGSMAAPTWRQALTTIRQEVEHGVPLSAALSRYSFFPEALTQMITVGEQTGKLDSVLETMSTFYHDQAEVAIKNMTSLIEPIVLLVVAVGVGFVVISVILPIYSLADQF